MKSYPIHIFCILLFSGGFLSAQNVNFKKFTHGDGLPNGYVYAIEQDQFHYLWLATAEGLARFDGHTFTTFKSADGLDEDFVHALYVDKLNNKWIGHFEGGITLFDNKTFTNIITENQINSRINKFYQVDNKGVLVCTQSNGLWRINQDLSVSNVTPTEHWGIIWDVAAVAPDVFLLATGEGAYLLKFNKDDKLVEKKLIKNTDYFSITNIVPVNPNTFLMGTEYDGIYKITISLDPIEATLTKVEVVQVGRKQDLSSGKLVFIQKDRFGSIWVSAENSGLMNGIFDNNQLIIHSNFDIDFAYHSTFCRSMLIDVENDLWIGTYGKGLYQSSKNIFQSYSTAESFTKKDIKSLVLHKGKIIYSVKNQLYEYDINSHTYKSLPYSIAIPKNDIPDIKSIYVDEKDKLYVCFDGMGVYSTPLSQMKFELFFCMVNDKPSCTINNMVKQNEKSFWFATDNGAYNLNPVTNAITRLSIQDGLPHNKVYYTYLDSQDRVWFGTHGSGITYFQDDKLNKLTSPLDKKGIDISTIYEDSNNNIWFGTYGQGILKLTHAGFEKQFTTRDGLGSDFCYTIVEDNNKNIWIGHKTGFTKLMPETRQMAFYENIIEYSDAEVNLNAVAFVSSSEIWYGTNQGLLKFNSANDLTQSPENINMVTKVKLFFDDINWSNFGLEQQITTPPDGIVLKHDQNHLTFEFTGISLSNPEKVKYKFMLYGYDKDWSLATKQNFITYSNLPPGKYLFRVVSSNKDGKWSKFPAEYTFEITPPFWLTWWFITLGAVAVGFLVYLAFAYRTHQLNKRILLQELEKQKLEHEIHERGLVEVKLQESQRLLKQSNLELHELMWRLYHDLRSPLKSIQGLIYVAMFETDEKAKKYFGLIQESTNKLDSILRDFSKVRIIKNFEFVITKIDFNALIPRVLETIKVENNTENINISYVLTGNSDFYSDESLIEVSLQNVLRNAVQYQQHEENVPKNIKIKIKKYPNYINILVADNGIGIARDTLDKVFAMFYKGYEKSKGNGLGLYIAKKNIEIMNGSISLHSRINKGTVVAIYLPTMKNT